MRYFPLEILELVIDALGSVSGESRKIPSACSLVCRRWVPRSRHHLFQKCRLYPSNVLAFGQLLNSPECTLLSRVRWIYVSRNFTVPTDRLFDSVADSVRRMTRVKILELSGIIDTRAATSFEYSFIATFEGIEELRPGGQFIGSHEFCT
ncbi:hypothetical protein K438DRAFT_1821452 [Mycena galopus ATCC 62051]|nr:hypothetical protein K438DRAFT_1821452 [Mycena galopus ATCC 62051]